MINSAFNVASGGGLIDDIFIDGLNVHSLNFINLSTLSLSGTNVLIQGLTYPALDGNSGEVLTTDGNGNLSFIPPGSAPVTSVNTKTGIVVLGTDDIAEGSTNLYYTDTRVNTNFATKTTDDLTEGSTNLYYSTTLFDTDFSTKTTTNLVEGTNLYYTNDRVDTRISFNSIDSLVDVDTTTSLPSTGQYLQWDGSNWIPNTLSISTTFLQLTDTPNNYTGQAGRTLVVNGSETALEFITSTNGDMTKTVYDPTNINSSAFDYNNFINVPPLLSTTDDLSEGATNLYFTNARVDTRISTTSIDALSDVDTTTIVPAAGQFLAWDGTNWKPSSSDTAISFLDLSDTPATYAGHAGEAMVVTATENGIEFHALGGIGDMTKVVYDPNNVASDTFDYDNFINTPPLLSTTDDLPEGGTNGYYTETRFDASLAIKTTTDLDEGTNLYYTDTRVSANTDVAANTAARHTHANKVQLDLITNGGSGIIISDTERTKLTGIEDGAEVNQTDAEIKTQYENNLDTNAFTDAEQTKLAGIGTGAEANTVDSVNTQTGDVVLDTDDILEGTNKYYSSSLFDTDFANKTTTDLDEGDNLYFTDTRVSANTDVTANTTARHSHSNKVQLDLITSAGSGIIISTTERTKLTGIEASAEVNQTDAEIKTQYENNANTNAYTDDEKTKLSTLESSKFLGTYTSLTALETAYPSPAEGSYAYVDSGAGEDTVVYIWDINDTQYVLQLGESTAETPASIKSKYESNADTNAFTDTEQTKLAGIEALAEVNPTALEIKTEYESNSDTNAFTDVEQTKLAGINAGAEVNLVDSVNTQTGDVVLDTDDIDEGSINFYFTDARFNTNFATKTTLDLTENTNLYYTETRVSANTDVTANTAARHEHSNKVQLDLITDAGSGIIISDIERTKLSGIEDGAEANVVDSVNTQTGDIVLDTDDIPEGGTNGYYTETRFDASLATKTTTDLTEGTNLYYTDTRVSANDDVAANTLKISADGSIDTHSDVDVSTAAPTLGEFLRWNGTNWIPGSASSAPIDSVFGRVGIITAEANDYVAEQITYENGTSGLASNNVQDALDELNIDVDANTNVRHTHINKLVLDDITAAGSGQIITVTERDNITINTANRHNHTNKVQLDLITDAGSGIIISNTERTKLTGIEAGAEVNVITSVNTQTGDVVLDTDDISEGTNKYYSSSLFDADLATKTTTDLTEGTNLYYTNPRVLAYINTLSIDELVDVDITTIAPNISDKLEWDGTNWVTLNPADQVLNLYQNTITTSISVDDINIPISWDGISTQGSHYGFTANTSTITINTDGRYLISYNLSLSATNNSRTQSASEILLNGATVDGSAAYSYHRNSNEGSGSLNKTLTLSLVSGNIIDIVSSRISGDSTLVSAPSGNSVTIVKL